MQEKIGKALLVLGVIILGITAYLLVQFGDFNKSNMTNEGII